jgi:hypothetical protein
MNWNELNCPSFQQLLSDTSWLVLVIRCDVKLRQPGLYCDATWHSVLLSVHRSRTAIINAIDGEETARNDQLPRFGFNAGNISVQLLARSNVNHRNIRQVYFLTDPWGVSFGSKTSYKEPCRSHSLAHTAVAFTSLAKVLIKKPKVK